MSQDVGQRHGNILVGTFRKIYGADFARGYSPTAKLSTAIDDLDQRTRAALQKDAESGVLEEKIRRLAA